MSTDRTLRPRAGSSGKDLLLTILGEFVLARGGSAWAMSLVEALGLVGIEEKNSRQAIARLTGAQILAGERRGRRLRCHLTGRGHDLLVSGAERIYGFGRAQTDWDGHFLVVLFAVPEPQRSKRHELRSRLAFAGFGFLGPGIAITPHLDREGLATSALKELGVADTAVTLRARAGELVSATELLDRGWNMDSLARQYRTFLRTFEALKPGRPRSQFSALTNLVHEWRRFPFIDPEFPDTLLPVEWPGRQAKALFDDRHSKWSPGASQAFGDLEAVNSGDGEDDAER